MLTRKLACPSCGVGLKVVDSIQEGKRIKCPKCGTPFSVPGDEVEATVRAASGPRTRTAPEPDEDLDEPVPQRPRARKKIRKKHNSSGLVLLIAGLAAAAVLLLAVGVTLAVVFWPFGKKPESVAGNTTPPAGPARAAAAAPEPGSGPQEGPGANVGAGSGGGESQDFALGKKVFAQSCAKCHAIGGGGSAGAAGGGPGGFGRGRGGRGKGPDLGTVGRNPAHTVDWLMRFIRNPKSEKPNSRMPSLEGKLSDAELRSLAEYLASLK
jgi:mono/diheme cytochrome c family protein